MKEKLLASAVAIFLCLRTDVSDAAVVMACQKFPDAINLNSIDGDVRMIVFKKSADGIFIKKKF